MIWKFVTDEESGLIAVESRNAELKEAAFSVFNYRDGSTLIKEKKFEQSWRLTLCAIKNGCFYLTAFESDSSPVSKGVIAADAKTGNILWQQFNISFYDARQEGLRVYNPALQPRKLELIDFLSGNRIKTEQLTSVPASILLPVIVDDSMLPGWLDHLPISGEVSYLVHPHKTFLCFHENTANGMQLRLIAYQGDTIFLDDILLRDIQKLQLETFMVQQNHLFYIRNRNEIVTYFV